MVEKGGVSCLKVFADYINYSATPIAVGAITSKLETAKARYVQARIATITVIVQTSRTREENRNVENTPNVCIADGIG